ncbi:hypothetical protein GS506_18605 [Rhodococcus hoagii]|nr:hypothetical protein [Prescottella equi]
MKVIYALRGDARAKPGGDTKKIDKYVTALSESGVETSIVTSVEELESSRYDICHLVNLDLPIENLRYARAARRAGARVAMSTVSHPIDGLRGLYEQGDDWFFKYCRALKIDAEYGISARESLKLIQRREMSPLSRPWGLSRVQQKLLAECDAIFPMAEGELAELSRRFDFEAPSVLVKNGVSFTRDIGCSSRPYDVIVVGRVEPRKNTVEIAELLARTGHRAVFVGPKNNNHKAYVQRFETCVDRASNLSYMGQRSPAEVKSLMQNSLYYVNAAWCEVVSQADIEAASQGCRVLSTKYSYLSDFIPGGFTEIDPHRIVDGGALGYLQGLLGGDAIAEAELPHDTWESAATSLLSSYAALA